MLVTMLIGGCVSVMAQQPPARTQVQVTPQTKPSPSGSAANAAAGMRLPSGTITGFVYWQMNVFQPQANCQGLTVKIVTVTKSGMPLQLLSTTSTLTANGPMTDDSAQGTPKYMLCSYAFQNMPENVSLRALLYGAPTTASVSTPSVLQIPGGNCNSTPSSTLSFILTGGEMLCGNGAFNVNFKVTFSPSAIERSPEKSTLIPNAGGPPHGLVEQPAARNSNVSSPTSGVTGGPPLLIATRRGLANWWSVATAEACSGRNARWRERDPADKVAPNYEYGSAGDRCRLRPEDAADDEQSEKRRFSGCRCGDEN